MPLMSPASCLNPGRCFAEQVGVKAPGTANSTTFLPLKKSSVQTVSNEPSLWTVVSFTLGIFSPTWIAIRFPFS